MYIYPSVTINFIAYTALRWGQFPTITYTTGATAGSEVVTIAPDLSDITIKIASGVSTNLQIKNAILAADTTVQSLYARDLISMSITSGHNSDTNTAVSATPMTGASYVFPRLNVQTFYEPFFIQQVYYGAFSNQAISSDLILDSGVGSADGSNPKFIASAMFNIFGDTLTKDANTLAGVIGAYSITGTKATTYSAGAVLGIISDGVTEVDGAVVAVLDGDSAQTKAGAAFTVRSNNTVPGSGFSYGLDLKGPTHDGYPAVAYLSGEMRFSNGTKVTVSGDTIVFTNAAGNKSATITMS